MNPRHAAALVMQKLRMVGTTLWPAALLILLVIAGLLSVNYFSNARVPLPWGGLLPSSSWYVMEAPRRTCVGPSDRGRGHCHHLTEQCFETGAPLNRWSRVGGVRRIWPLNFDSEDACADRIKPNRGREVPLFLCPELRCVRADDPRLAK